MNKCLHKSAYYTVKRMRLLEYLMNKGFKPAKTIPDATNPKYNWWLFVNTPELETEIHNYFNK